MLLLNVQFFKKNTLLLKQNMKTIQQNFNVILFEFPQNQLYDPHWPKHIMTN